jgi:hypothetical protein
MPADDSFNFLFRYAGDVWELIDERWCDRWGGGCDFEALPEFSTDLWAWSETRGIWHPDIANNPFLVGQETIPVDLKYENYQGADQTRIFEIDDVEAILRFFNRPSEHSDTTHTFGIQLSIDGAEPQILSENQCLTSVVGRHILVREFFGGRFEVTDLGTGEVLVGNLKTAAWID